MKTKESFRLDLTGQTFGRLMVLAKMKERGPRGEIHWQCQCSCGKRLRVRAKNLRSGNTQSCGCYQRDVVSSHGMTGLPTFKSWLTMKQRCANPKAPDYARYGGRGIHISDTWFNSFDAFLADMGERPKGTTLDRINPDGNYEPSNCRWATPREQQLNRCDTRRVLWNGRMQTIYDLAAESGLRAKIIGDRLYAGWAIEKIMATPSRKKRI